MRVIAGTAKGRRLKGPSGTVTRPITDRIKEALFNIIGQRLLGSIFLDLFAGSGSVGIEALSRGATRVVFVDNSPAAIKTIRENLAACKFESGFEVYRNDVFKAIPILVRRGLSFDFIYMDPPFTELRVFAEVLQAVDQVPILAAEGIAIIRLPRKYTLSVTLENLEQCRSDNYGESTLVYYKHRDREGK